MTESTRESTAQSRPLRADAERNRRAIICAAERVLAEKGTDVTLEHIADVAGVGVGTIYRRFASIEDLVGVVLEAKISQYADRAEQAAEEALTEPWAAFKGYVLFILEQQAQDLAFSELILRPSGASAAFRASIGRALDATILLSERAKVAGAIRPDFDHGDIYLLLNANAGIVRGAGRAAPDVWRRFGIYALQAFRTQGDEELPPPPASWTRASNARKATRAPRTRKGDA